MYLHIHNIFIHIQDVYPQDICTQAYIHRTYAYIYTSIYIEGICIEDVHVNIYTCIHMCAYAHPYIHYMHVYMHVYIHNIHAYICM